MFTRHSRAAAGLALTLTVVLVVLPACDKKKDTGSDNPAPGTGPNTGPGTGAGGGPAAPWGGLGLSRANTPHVTTGRTHLLQIGFALHSFELAYGMLPAGVYGPDGRTLGLSWRVAVLPYLDQGFLALYKQFKLNEPWDSDHNKKLIGQMPRFYAPPGGFTPAGYTYYRAFTGPEAMLQVSRPGAAGQLALAMRLTQVTDGLSNTAMVAEAAEAVVWTKPDELVLAAKGPPPRLGGVFLEGANVLTGDGSVRFLPLSTPADTVRALITASGGEVINLP